MKTQPGSPVSHFRKLMLVDVWVWENKLCIVARFVMECLGGKKERKKRFPEYHCLGSGQPRDSLKNENF